MDQPIRLVRAPAAGDSWWPLRRASSAPFAPRARPSARSTPTWMRRRCSTTSVARSYPLDPTVMEKRHVEEFLIHLREERGAKPATVRNRFSALRRFFNFLLDEAEIQHSPMARMRGPRVDELPPEVLTDAELSALLRACEG